MNIKSRIEKLEQASPADVPVSVLWRSIVRRDEHGNLIEKPHSAHILAGPHGPAASLARQDGEDEATFNRRVIDAAQRIHGKSGPVFEAEVSWQPQPETHHTE